MEVVAVLVGAMAFYPLTAPFVPLVEAFLAVAVIYLTYCKDLSNLSAIVVREHFYILSCKPQ